MRSARIHPKVIATPNSRGFENVLDLLRAHALCPRGRGTNLSWSRAFGQVVRLQVLLRDRDVKRSNVLCTEGRPPWALRFAS